MSHLAIAAGVLFGSLFLAWLYMYPVRAATIPYRNLKGPEPSSGFFGSLLEQVGGPVGGVYKRWAEFYGPTLRFRGILGQWRIVSTDPVAVNWVLNHTGQFHRQTGFNVMVQGMCGRGVLVVEDATHRRQRRVLSPAFSMANVKGMMPVFWEKAYELDRKLGNLIESAESGKGGKEGTPEGATGGAQIDMHKYVMYTALDTIGQAGFNYDFESQNGGTNPLSDELFAAVNISQKPSLLHILRLSFTPLFAIPTAFTRQMAATLATQKRVGKEIVAARRKELDEEHIHVEKRTDIGKDAISLLMKANLAPDLRDDQRLTEDEILGQIGTLMLAGNETSATALAWSTLHLMEHPEIQQRLRAEVDAVPDDRPDADLLMNLPYLDNFVHEVLRYDPPLPQVVRMCVQDTVVPLSKPVIGRDGKTMENIRVSAGTEFVVPINEINRSTDVWGPDADKFNPDRFDDKTYPLTNVPGVWGNLVTFIGGPHNCVGWRFAIMEIKCVLFVLMRNYTVETPPSRPRMERRGRGFVQRPIVIGNEAEGIQMPTLIRRLNK